MNITIAQSRDLRRRIGRTRKNVYSSPLYDYSREKKNTQKGGKKIKFGSPCWNTDRVKYTDSVAAWPYYYANDQSIEITCRIQWRTRLLAIFRALKVYSLYADGVFVRCEYLCKWYRSHWNVFFSVFIDTLHL